MRSLTALAVLAALAAPAWAQGLPPVGIPLEPDKAARPVDPVKENEYRSAIGGLPTPKSSDPWGSLRESKPAAPAPGKKTPTARDKGTPGAKKSSSSAKATDAPKKTD